MVPTDDILAQVLTHYSRFGEVLRIDRIDAGLINKTYRVKSDRTSFILQEISPIFETTINDDSEAVSRRLALAGIRVPTIFLTEEGALFCRRSGRVFRALELIAGQTFHKIASDEMAREAGRVLGRFHAALEGFDYAYKSLRPHGGNYGFHRQNLEKALKQGEGHDYFSKVMPLAEIFLAKLGALTAELNTTPRHAHGDPKISNILFDDEKRGICLIDFDTLGKTGWSLELADAMRSWCNKNPEDVLDAKVDTSVAELALRGYAEAMAKKITPAEVEEFVIHAQAITLCLASRYLADALNERYFAFDKKRFVRAAPHNLLRAQAMYNLFGRFQECAGELRRMARDLLL